MAIQTPYNQIAANRFKTWLIMFLFALFVCGVVYVFARWMGYTGPSALSFTGMALIITGIMNFISYFYSDKIVMAMSGAKQILQKDNPKLFNMVENLCIATGMPLPKVYIVDDPSPNAFATGRSPKHAAIAFTTGILERLDNLELEGVAAHELSHVRNRDTLLMTVVTILAGTVAILADWAMRMSFFRSMSNDSDNRSSNGIFAIVGIALAILAPLVATLIQLAISRRREYLADASGVLITRNPDGLADALIKIAQDPMPTRSASAATEPLYFVSPFKSDIGRKVANLFNTHPPIEDRVRALRAMEGSSLG